MELVLCQSADSAVFFAQRNILQVVKVAENAQLAELGHTRKHGKAYMLVLTFEIAVKGPELGSEVLLSFGIVNCFKEWFVVFINKYHDLFTGHLMGLDDDFFKSQ